MAPTGAHEPSSDQRGRRPFQVNSFSARGTNGHASALAANRFRSFPQETAHGSLKAPLIVVDLCLLSGLASAQTTQAPPSSTQQPTVAGANSFTEAQAQERIEKAGFTEVKALKKDDQGIWRGTAMQSGKQVNVALDFQGNVVSNQ